ncbi:alkaline ceramidase [Candidatus Laterigemmans baculatus]|uniref:alkaline ceramidase n=1 Tax=Candidatus Laterigemmans baculatus TaxID=2770505 RepID=UPI0013D914E7|nr:alkaline ceramidase [Candidatus Laterigemmans baculatus]
MENKHPLHFSHASFRGRVGIARVDITPPVGIYARNWGAAKHDVAESVHRPLTLTALSLTSPSHPQPLVFLDADLGWWKTPHTFRQFMDRLQESVELAPPRLLFGLSHTHAGPPLMQAEEALPGSELLRDWMEDLLAKAVQVVDGAIGTAFDATLDWHRGSCDLAAHRDLPDPENPQGRMVCGFNPAGAPDDALWVGRVVDSSGRIRGTLTNYACHPTTLAWDNTAISPDYVGAMRETIEKSTEAPALFLLGACGDLAPRYQYVGDPAVADRHGRQLGYATLATLEAMEPAGTQLVFSETVESGAPLAVWKHQSYPLPQDLRSLRTTVELPLKDWPTAEELECERLRCSDRALEERLRRKRDIRRGIGDGATYSLPLFAWRMGSAVLIGCCCEPYSILQQTLRTRFPQNPILCLNLINGSIGYLPPADLYETDVYPVWQTPFDRGSLELTIDAMTEAVQALLNQP